MIYIIEKHLPSSYNVIDIYDESGEVYYTIDSQMLLGQRKLVLSDIDGQNIAVATRILPSIESKYQIDIEGSHSANIIQRFSFFEPDIQIDTEYGKLYIEGDILNFDFSFVTSEGEEIANVKQDLIEDETMYGVMISDLYDEELVLILLVIIDVMLNE